MKSRYFSPLLFVLLLSSCNEALIEKPLDRVSPNQFFNSDNEAISAVNGVYSRLTTQFGVEGSIDLGYWTHLGTDLALPTGGREANYIAHSYTLSASNTSNLADLWRYLYRVIGDANLVINRVGQSTKISAPIRQRVVGEALFLRAYAYYWLTIMWGDVPFWLDELNIEEVGGAIPRTSVSQIRTSMVTDLLKAANDLPSTYADADKGRATKWAAKMLLCKYFLWQNDWNAVKTTASDIIDNSPHALQKNFADIFGVKNEYNPELIWEIDFVQDVFPSILSSRYVPRQIDEPAVPGFALTGFGLITSAKEFVASFDTRDQRLALYNWNGNGSIKTKFSYTTKFIDWAAPRSNSGVNTLIFRLADAYLMLAEAENEIGGPSALAYTRINTIRSRAGLPPLQGLSKEEFRLAIMNERKWELAFEYDRRWDLVRWGKLVDAVKQMTTSNPQGVTNIKPHHVLFPIPPQEIGKNSALTQNPGY